MDQWVKYWKENKIQVILGLLGLFFLLAGLVTIFSGGKARESSVEIVSVDEGSMESNEKIFVDVAGAVQKPGVYELSTNARINDALVIAGGFSKEADRIWVRRFVNLAQIIPDGSKIYIPAIGENDSVIKDNSSITEESSLDKVNINSASVSQLDGLWGIGEARAKYIVDGRPYSNIEEIKTKAQIPDNVFEKIKEKISVF